MLGTRNIQEMQVRTDGITVLPSFEDLAGFGAWPTPASRSS